MFRGPTFTFGAMEYPTRRIAALPSERRKSWDGILGSGFFRRFVVQFQPSAKTLTLHEPRSYQRGDAGHIIPMSIRSGTPVIEAALVLSDGQTVPGRYEVDTGCDGGLCVGRDFAVTNRLHDRIDHLRQSGRRGVGGSAESRAGNIPSLQIGKLRVANPEIHIFASGSPVGPGLAGHIGWEVLEKLSSVTFDYSRKELVLVP